MADQFGWIGSARQALVLAAVRAAAVSWLEGWCSESAAVDVVPWAAHGSSEGDDVTWFAKTSSLAIGFDGSVAGFGASLAGVAEDGDPLADHLGRDAAAAFLDALATQAGRASQGTALTAIDVLSPSLRDPRLGSLGIAMTSAAVAFRVVVGRELVDALAPPLAVAPVVLTGRRSLVEGLRQDVEVTLDLGELSLRDAQNLRPGDVLATDIHLDVLARLSAGGITLEGLAARAGRHGSHRAIALEIINAPEH